MIETKNIVCDIKIKAQQKLWREHQNNRNRAKDQRTPVRVENNRRWKIVLKEVNSIQVYYGINSRQQCKTHWSILLTGICNCNEETIVKKAKNLPALKAQSSTQLQETSRVSTKKKKKDSTRKTPWNIVLKMTKSKGCQKSESSSIKKGTCRERKTIKIYRALFVLCSRSFQLRYRKQNLMS